MLFMKQEMKAKVIRVLPKSQEHVQAYMVHRRWRLLSSSAYPILSLTYPCQHLLDTDHVLVCAGRYETNRVQPSTKRVLPVPRTF